MVSRENNLMMLSTNLQVEALVDVLESGAGVLGDYGVGARELELQTLHHECHLALVVRRVEPHLGEEEIREHHTWGPNNPRDPPPPTPENTPQQQPKKFWKYEWNFFFPPPPTDFFLEK